ncbi:MAG: NUDIX domain-containing protein [Paludibacter sp.]|jgi:isopentenyldiphosphate isomerase|nr:NUDIX domain-containing protein [Paludibacter sp.]
MKRLRKQINETFFNPVIHFLPLIVFMVVNDFWDLKTAWVATLPVVFILFLYIFFFYRKIVEWFLFSASVVFVVGAAITFLPVHKLHPLVAEVALESAVLLFFIFSLVFRRSIESVLNKRKSKLPPMVNNLNEMFRMLWMLGAVIFVYIHIYLITASLPIPNLEYTLQFIHDAYLVLFLFVVFYELIRVTLIRVKLFREEWWPILNEKGKMIGSIHNKTSLSDPTKYIHPIIRVMLIEDNRIFLQKRCQQDLVYPGYWDTALSNHVKVNETVEQCISRTANERYGIKDLKPIFLSNYMHETDFEYHYAFLFVACKLPELEHNKDYIDHAKWWTVQQIEDNLSTDIFTENFLSEFELVKRSGLLDTGRCDCECRLKETIQNSAFLS